MNYKNLTWITVLAVLLGGCLMGPDYKRPDMLLPNAVSAEDFSIFEKTNWWAMFNDSELDKLEEEALVYNRDLRLAIARVDEARANVGLAVSDQLPSLALAGGTGRSGNENDSQQTISSATAVLSYELDLWGKYRRLSEAARAELLSTTAAQDTVRLALTANVANTYFALRTLDLQLEIAKRTLETRRESYRIYESRYNIGYATEVDLRRVEADMLSVQSTEIELSRQVAAAETALSVLVGRSPREIVQSTVNRGESLESIYLVPDVPQGIPSEVISRRPDIRQAEGSLMAANARIGAARAAYFPSIPLTAAAGYASPELGNLFHNSTSLWAIGANVMQPIFAGGAIRSQNKAAQARYRQMLASYEKTVQTAFKEVMDALSANRLNRETFDARVRQTAALRRGYELTKKQEDAGLIGTMELLDVERNLLQAEMDLATARKNELSAVAALSQALGGGWSLEGGFGPYDEAVKAYQQNQLAQEAAAQPKSQAVPMIEPATK